MIEAFNNTFIFIHITLGIIFSFWLTVGIYLFLFVFLYWLLAVTVDKIEDKIDDLKDYIAKKQGKKCSTIRFNREKYEEIWKKEEEWDKKHPILAWLKEMRRILWYRVPDYPWEIKNFIREKYQRAVRGWSISDTWRFPKYISRVLIEGIKWLKENKHGVPCDIGIQALDLEDGDKELEKAKKEYNSILDEIIWMLEITQEIGDRGLYYIPSSKWTSKQYVEYNNIWKKGKFSKEHRAMTLEECKRYEKAQRLFWRYYLTLWD